MIEQAIHPVDSADLPPGRALGELLRLAGPTVAQMGSYTLMQFLDTWMLARLGETAPTAAGNSGMFAFSVISLGMGVLWVVNTLVSQSFGRGDFASCGRYLWQGVWFSLTFSLLLLPALPIVNGFFQHLGHSPELVEMEGSYLRIVIGLSVFKLIGTVFAQFLLAINRPNCVFVATFIGVGANAIAAWILVLGHLGVKSMGVPGAAWAQNIGVMVEMTTLILFAVRPSLRAQFNLKDWRPRAQQIKTLLFVGFPSGLQVVADVLAWSLFGALVMAKFETKAMAANTFMFRYMVVSFMPAFGISAAVTALVGRYIGMGRPDIAQKRANLAFAVTAIYMVACGIFFFLGRNVLIRAFTDDPETLKIGATLLIFCAVYQFFDALYITYNGALRGAGDTLVPAVATAVLNWSLTVFGGYLIAVYFHQFGPAGPWTIATFYGGVLGIFIYVRFRRGHWKKIQLEAPGSKIGPDSARFAGLRQIDGEACVEA